MPEQFTLAVVLHAAVSDTQAHPSAVPISWTVRVSSCSHTAQDKRGVRPGSDTAATVKAVLGAAYAYNLNRGKRLTGDARRRA